MLSGLRRLFRLTKTTVVLLVVCGSFGFALLSFAFAPLANMMLAAAQRLAFQPALVAAADLATAQDREKAAQRRAVMLEAEQKAARTRSKSLSRELEKVQANLDEERRKTAKFSDQIAESNRRLNAAAKEISQSRMRGSKMAGKLEGLRKASLLPDTAINHIDRLTAGIVKRSGVNAARNLASMPLESLPVVGALTIVSVTALEIHDACQTAAEMEELRRLASLPDVDTSAVRRACAKIPTLGGLSDLTLVECRDHESKVRRELGPEASAPIKRKCDCLELPDGCPGEEAETVRVPSPSTELP